MIRTLALAALFLLVPGAHAHNPGNGTTPSATARKAKAIQWASSYDVALNAAVDSGLVIFVAVNMDGERANDRMAEKVYKDKVITVLAAQTVNLVASAGMHKKKGKCPRFGCSSCAAHRSIDIAVRERILKGDASGAVVAPQHVFVSSGGKVLLSVPYEISVSELEWCFLEALAMQAGVDTGKRKHAGRRPRRLIVGDVLDLGGIDGTVTREEALEIIREHKKGSGRGDGESALRRLVMADEPEARDYIITVLRAGGGGGGGGRGGGGRGGGGGGGGADATRAALIRWIGVTSPQSYWEICAEFADSGAESVQNEAVVALEQLACGDSLKMLMKALRRASTNPAAQKNLVRAIGAVAQDDKKARVALLRASVDKKNEAVRANALIALGWLDAHEDITQRLLEAAIPAVHGAKSKIAPDKVTDNERLGAVVAMGISRNSDWTETLRAIADDEDETNEKLRNAARAALRVIDGKAYTDLARFLKAAGSDKIERERLFGFTGPMPPRPPR